MVQQCRRCGQVHDGYTSCTSAGRLAAGPPYVDEDVALVGNVVADRYHIRDIVGVGSTGTVFGVEHLTFARAAAMKVLRPRSGNPELVSRVFHGEARAAWSVRHACLCEVFDIGTLPDGAPFFVMERLEGETLATRIGRERLSLAAAVDVLMQMLSAIAVVHARDLLVRDLRPENIYLAHRRGCRPLLKILDFGLARLNPLERLQQEWGRSTAARAQGAGGSTASPFYLSPERARGEHAVEPASDLFVAACIFYEALAGQRPFTASSWNDLLATIAHGTPPSLDELRPDVSPELSAFVLRCLAAEPRQRPSSAKDMQDELRAIFDGVRRASASGAPAAGPRHAQDENASSTFSSIAAPPMPHLPHRSASTAEARATSGSAERGARFDATYENETETQRAPPHASALDRETGRGVPRLSLGEPEDELSTAARRVDPALLRIGAGHVDEASAESAERTVPPPPSLDVDVSFDDNTERTIALSPHGATAAVDIAEDEETETMELTPELRARVDQLMATKPAPVPIVPKTATKPPRR